MNGTILKVKTLSGKIYYVNPDHVVAVTCTNSETFNFSLVLSTDTVICFVGTDEFNKSFIDYFNINIVEDCKLYPVPPDDSKIPIGQLLMG